MTVIVSMTTEAMSIPGNPLNQQGVTIRHRAEDVDQRMDMRLSKPVEYPLSIVEYARLPLPPLLRGKDRGVVVLQVKRE